MLKVFDFENPAEYQKSDNVKIENGLASLIKNSDLIQDLIFFMPFYDNINILDKGNGVISFNKASIDSNYLKLLNETQARWGLNAIFDKTGTLRINFKVNSLKEDVNFIFTLLNGTQQFYISYYKNMNSFRVFLRDKNNISVLNTFLSYVLTENKEYQLEIGFDTMFINNNKIYIFLDGGKIYQNDSFIGDFDNFTSLIIGNYVGYSYKPEWVYRNFLFWNTIKHINNYNYLQEFIMTRFTQGFFNTLETIQTDKIYSVNINATDVDFLLEKNNKKYYYNGNKWIEGNIYIDHLTFSEKILFFNNDLKDGGILKFFMRINTDGWNSVGEVRLFEIVYDYWGGNVVAPEKTLVYGNIFDIDGNINKVTFYLYYFDECFNLDKIFIPQKKIKVETYSNGYFEVNLLKNKKYLLKIKDKIFLFKTNNKDTERINNLIIY